MVTPGSRRGFTLLELVVTFVLLGILAGVGVVSFHAATSAGADTQANAALDAVLASEQRFSAAYGSFSSLGADLSGLPAGVTAVDGPSGTTDEVSVALSKAGALGLATRSASGSCHGLAVPAPGASTPIARSVLSSDTVCEGLALLPPGDPPVAPVSAK